MNHRWISIFFIVSGTLTATCAAGETRSPAPSDKAPDNANSRVLDAPKIGSGLTPGSYGGASQVMKIAPDGRISYGDGHGLCQMTVYADDRIKVAFRNERQIWTDFTLPLVTGANTFDGKKSLRAAWSAEIDGHTYRATATPFSTNAVIFQLEKLLKGKLIDGSLGYFAIPAREAKDATPAPAPINLKEWRVDRSGTGVVAGRYTGASQVMQIAADGTVSYSDRPEGICHLAVLEDNRLTATFRNSSGNPEPVTLPLVKTAAQRRAVWSAEIDGHTLRVTAVPYSSNVYIFRLEKLFNGKLIAGSREFYAIEQKLRKATPEELNRN